MYYYYSQYFILHISGTDTIKRGASPAASVSSTSTAKFRESGSSYSIRHIDVPDSADTSKMSTTNGTRYTTTPTTATVSTATVTSTSSTGTATSSSSLSTYGPNNNSSDLFPSRSVLFTSSATDSTSVNRTGAGATTTISQTTQSLKSPSNYSSYSISSLNKTTTASPSSSTSSGINSFSTRNYQKTDNEKSTEKSKPQFLPSLSGYQIPSSFDDLPRVSSLSAFGHTSSSSSSTSSTTSTVTTTSSPSPSRLDYSNINTLPSSNVARNMLYQSESSYSIRSNQQTTNVASSGTSNMNIYGTLPKTSNPSYLQSYSNNSQQSSTYQSSSVSPSSSSNYSLTHDTSNLFERSTSGSDRSPPNVSSTVVTSGTDRYRDTFGSSGNGSSSLNTQYRVQYASTNPFLPTFNPGDSQQMPNINLTSNDDNEDDLK